LKYFGLNSISDLPKPRELDEIMQDEDFLEQKRKIMMASLEEKLEESIKKTEDENPD
jgi:segregation and condensation protein B